MPGVSDAGPISRRKSKRIEMSTTNSKLTTTLNKQIMKTFFEVSKKARGIRCFWTRVFFVLKSTQ